MSDLTLLLGGARSGKSRIAEAIAQQHQHVLYIATAQAFDSEMQARITRHISDRPTHWQTLEANLNVAATLTAVETNATLVLLDCITMLVSNVMLATIDNFDTPNATKAEAAVQTELEALLATIKVSKFKWILVSNEVGLGLVPENAVGRLYRDILGRVNQRLAEAANQSYFLIAGKALPLHSLDTLF